MESGELELDEWTALGIINGFRAAGENLPFEVMQSPAGSSLAAGFARGLDDPFGGDGPPMSAVPPLPMDVLLLHAQRADDDGNVELAGARGLDMPAIFAADRVYVTVEERVRRGELGAARSFVRAAHVRHPGRRGAVRRVPDVVPAPLPGRLPCAARDRGRRTGRPAARADPRAGTADRAHRAGRAARGAGRRGTRRAPGAAPPEYTAEYTTDELMVCVLARTIGPDDICSVGAASPLPTAAYLLAKHLWAPDLLLMSHNGGLVDLPVRPLSLAAAEFLDHHLAAAHTGGDETYHWYYQRGLITHEVVGAAQVDGTGATNNLWVSKHGRYAGAAARPGRHGRRGQPARQLHGLPAAAEPPATLVAKLGTVSARRAWHDAEQRRRYGLRPGRTIVLTDLGMFELRRGRSAALTLRTLHPGVDLDDLRDRTGFEVIAARRPDHDRAPDRARS